MSEEKKLKDFLFPFPQKRNLIKRIIEFRKIVFSKFFSQKKHLITEELESFISFYEK